MDERPRSDAVSEICVCAWRHPPDAGRTTLRHQPRRQPTLPEVLPIMPLQYQAAAGRIYVVRPTVSGKMFGRVVPHTVYRGG